MAHTYILYSASLDKYYIGHTQGPVEERLRRHLSNHDGFTGTAKDWVVAFVREFESVADAADFERKIKRWKSKKAIQNLIAGA